MKTTLNIEEANKTKNYPIASRDLRLTNHMIDSFVIVLLSIPIAILFFYISSSGSTASSSNSQDSFQLLSYIIIGLSTLIYYIISEFYFSGKTVGKFITKTRAITLDNQKMDFGTTLKRSFCRLVPFNPLSFLGGLPIGWHDKWSNTKVIVDEKI